MGVLGWIKKGVNKVANFGKKVWGGIKTGFGKVKEGWDSVKSVASKVADLPVVGPALKTAYELSPAAKITGVIDTALGQAGGTIKTIDAVGKGVGDIVRGRT